MRKILGLDLGTASIGWAVISEENENTRIEAIGSRIIPLSNEDADEFSKGNAISKNASRTLKRTQRKCYDRYQQRRTRLTQFFKIYGMLPDEELIKLEKLQLWGLRAKAVSERLTLPEIGRVLYHINQKRGYKSVREDNNDKKQREYVENVLSRHKEIIKRNITIGQLFFEELSNDSSFRTKERVFPRKAYVEEFDKIMACQKIYYPHVFTDDNIDLIRNQIIFYQRLLKSCKHLVSLCDFEKREFLNKEGRIIIDGPKVAPKSSPLAQICKIWESINNLVLKNRRGEELFITQSQRQAIFNHLDNNEILGLSDLYRILGISRLDGWWGGKAIGKGLQGNTTKNGIRKSIGEEYQDVLKFEVQLENSNLVDVETGEVVQIVSTNYLDEPLYRLWHLLYSIKDKEDLANALKKKFNITDQSIVENLYALDFVKQGYTNKSAKSMRRIIPYLELGLKYSEACEAAGFNHSSSLTKDENQCRELVSKLQPIQKNELRQPIVEKILNQMINVVNALMDKFGRFDEIRVELARELKQSKDERNETFKAMSKAKKENEIIASRILSEYKLTPTRSRIQKYKLWIESQQTCFYCGQPVSVNEFLNGFDVEREHILPRSVYFDDSFSNKVCACRKCNKEKNNQTAYDYMLNKPDFNAYLERIEKLYKDRKISKTKYERLLTPGDKIPTDFIDRQLRESQYIARKSREILASVCYNVTATSGSVTDFIRRIWGWDRVLHNLNFERYQLAGLTEIKEREHKEQFFNEEIIKDWSKRMDHRHHAIDALVVACTKQGFIQRINNMNELKDVSFAPNAKQSKAYGERLTKLEKYILSQQHFTTTEVEKAVDPIFVSFKSGKKAATIGKRYIHRDGKRILVQKKIIIPRGALHAESISGEISRYNSKGILQKENVIKYKIGIGQGCLFNSKDDKKKIDKTIDSIVDKGIAKIIKKRVEERNYDLKGIFSDPIRFNNSEIKSVRCFTGNKAVLPVRNGFVVPDNNHHIAIYIDKDGKRHENCVTFWHAVERKKYNIPTIIIKPAAIWDNLPEDLSEEFLKQLPLPDWKFEVSLQQNDMFVLGLDPETLEEALNEKNYSCIGKCLYKVQNISTKTYRFCLHNLTQYDISQSNKPDRRFFNIRSIDTLFKYDPLKVRISLLGEITKV